MTRRRRSFKFPLYAIAILLIGVGVFFGAQWITKTGFFKIPGVVVFGESLIDEEREMLKDVFTDDVVLDKDVEISARYSFEKPSTDREYIYNIYVPVTDFYSLEDNIEISEPDNFFADSFVKDVSFEMIPLDELDYSKKLLAINGTNYLDDYNKGAVYRVILFESDKFDEEIRPLVAEKFSKEGLNAEKVLTFVQTGVTALSRGMNTKLGAVGDANYFAEGISSFLSAFDLTHTSNESSFSELATGDNICSDVRFIDTLTAIGLDIVELTGNHNMDCGAEAARKTIDIYSEKGIKTVGGGRNATEAAIPLEIKEKDAGVTFLAYNQSTGGATLGELPGANQYMESNATSEIKKAKERGDLVIVDIQYYECSAHASEYEDPTCDFADSSAGDQIGLFRHLIELGADVVVGTSAHQPQTFELYQDGIIFYGLGNLFFDQVWWPGTTRSLALVHYINGNKLLQTKVYPTAYDATMQTKLMDADSAKQYLGRLINARP